MSPDYPLLFTGGVWALVRSARDHQFPMRCCTELRGGDAPVSRLDAADCDSILQHFTDAVRSRVRGSQPQALLAHMHEFLLTKKNSPA